MAGQLFESAGAAVLTSAVVPQNDESDGEVDSSPRGIYRNVARDDSFRNRGGRSILQPCRCDRRGSCARGEILSASKTMANPGMTNPGSTPTVFLSEGS